MANENNVSIIEKIKILFNEVVAELKKVTWPTKKQVTTSTIVVLILVFLTAVYLNVVDLGFSYLVSLIFR
ncbi:MAG: preprotein translocase subunit SecE [bacterium]